MKKLRKQRTVKTRITKLLQVYNGSPTKLAEALGIDRTYIHKMLGGMVPGKFLYHHIVNFYEETMSTKGEMNGSGLEDRDTNRAKLNQVSPS